MIRTFQAAEEAVSWLREQATRLAMDSHIDDFGHFPVTGKPIAESDDPESKWVVGSDGVGRPDGRFYRVQNVRTSVSSGREVTFWFSPMIVGDAEGLILLITDESGERVLIRAKAEPGNVGVEVDGEPTRLLFSPPFQASVSNMSAHGNRVPLVEVAKTFRDWERGSEDGGAFLREGQPLRPARR